MKSRFLRFLAIGVIVVFFGCASTQGLVEDDIYTAKDASFSVTTPFKSDPYANRYMEVQEQYSNRENQVVFTSTAAPMEVYKVFVFKNVEAEENLKEIVRNAYYQQFESFYGTPVEPKSVESITISGFKTKQLTFRQKIPETKSVLENRPELTITHLAYYVEAGSNAAYIFVNKPSDGDIFVEGSETRIRDFVHSFKLN
ncbi:hypothetical protein [Vibrio coralliilyticus]|uniref:hypothetical protein n=1 Tax=Vibrio coralliilyticus TaxID=190893 RepID=UPI000BAB108D|nr:hypothetical protein [Vibrio coralliilyticus]NOI60953.1 hypothetical protein [Vibrio coralliilyticus]PAT65206.1 hypothetical protein CKA27_25885 [Vibrio coralliilyticus]